MKIPQAWQFRNGNVQIIPVQFRRSRSRRPHWIIILICLVCVSLIGAYVYPPRRYSACYFFSSSICSPLKDLLPPTARVLTDDEFASNVLIKNILSMPSVELKNSKIAFMFLTPGSLPFERLWEKFFLVMP